MLNGSISVMSLSLIHFMKHSIWIRNSFSNYQSIVWLTSMIVLVHCSICWILKSILTMFLNCRCVLSHGVSLANSTNKALKRNSFNCEIRHRGWITFRAKSTRIWQFVKTTDSALTLQAGVIKVDETLRLLRTN